MSTPTTADILRAIFDRNVRAYEAQLGAFGKAMPKKTRECLIDGFKDGQAASVRALKDLGLFHVVETKCYACDAPAIGTRAVGFNTSDSPACARHGGKGEVPR